MASYNSVGNHSICIKCGRPLQNHMPITVKVKIKVGSRISIWQSFVFKNRETAYVVISRPWIEVSGWNLVIIIIIIIISFIKQLNKTQLCTIEQKYSAKWTSITGMPIALDLPESQTCPSQKPEVHLRRYCRHFVKSIWRHNSVGDHPICIKFGRPV